LQITSFDAFTVGAPIVTVPSLLTVMPLTAGMYRRMGITQLIAQNLDDYVKKALSLAGQFRFVWRFTSGS
jgi:predicted O-linked N-acetylglucosamine transferase (SPINDLY family)